MSLRQFPHELPILIFIKFKILFLIYCTILFRLFRFSLLQDNKKQKKLLIQVK